MVRVFAYLRLTPAEGDPVTLSHPVWTVDDPVYPRDHRTHRVNTNKGFAIYPLAANAGQVTIQARYEPQRGIAPGENRSTRWYEDLGQFAGPESLAKLEGQVVTLEWGGLAAPMMFSALRITPRRYVDPNGNEPVGAPIYVDCVMTFLETDPQDRWLASLPAAAAETPAVPFAEIV